MSELPQAHPNQSNAHHESSPNAVLHVGSVAIGPVTPGISKSQGELLTEQTHLDPNFVEWERSLQSAIDTRSDADERVANGDVFIDWATQEHADTRVDARSVGRELEELGSSLIHTLRASGEPKQRFDYHVGETVYVRNQGPARSPEEQEKLDELTRHTEAGIALRKAVRETQGGQSKDIAVIDAAGSTIDEASEVVAKQEKIIKRQLEILNNLNPVLTSELTPEDLSKIINERLAIETKIKKSQDAVWVFEHHKEAIQSVEEDSEKLGYTVTTGFGKPELKDTIKTYLPGNVPQEFLKDADAKKEFNDACNAVTSEHDMLAIMDLVLDKVGVRHLLEERQMQLQKFDAEYAEPRTVA